jgi:hypothetical protein
MTMKQQSVQEGQSRSLLDRVLLLSMFRFGVCRRFVFVSDGRRRQNKHERAIHM